jgi:hypothetical protein
MEKKDPKSKAEEILGDRYFDMEHQMMMQEMKSKMTERINQNDPKFLSLIKTLIDEDKKNEKF